MTRVVLTVGCVGKTYADENFSNVYDFDKHTLDYKYDRTGYEHLSNEEFKGLPNRKIKDGWFEKYMTDFCAVIDSGDYDVVTGWLQEDTISYLVEKGYDVELVLVSPDSDFDVYKERAKSRGNSDRYWEGLRGYYESTYYKYFLSNSDKRVWVLSSPITLSDFLVLTGTNLKHKSWGDSSNEYYTYFDVVRSRVNNAFEGRLDIKFVNAYSSLILTMLELDLRGIGEAVITNRMVHDSWASVMVNEDSSHQSLVPYTCLSKEVQDLDSNYTKVLNEVLRKLSYDLLVGLKYTDSTPYISNIQSFY